MTRPAINPGVVDWSGENPGVYLRESEDGAFVTLVSYFRVVVSPKGRGHAAFILQDPHGGGKGVAGEPFPREFAGKKNSSTAFLAYSETWVRV